MIEIQIYQTILYMWVLWFNYITHETAKRRMERETQITIVVNVYACVFVFIHIWTCFLNHRFAVVKCNEMKPVVYNVTVVGILVALAGFLATSFGGAEGPSTKAGYHPTNHQPEVKTRRWLTGWVVSYRAQEKGTVDGSWVTGLDCL